MAQSRLDHIDELRAAVAISAVAVGVLICAHQQHFLLVASPASLGLMLYHRCGQVMALAVLWAALESAFALTRLLRRPASSAARAQS